MIDMTYTFPIKKEEMVCARTNITSSFKTTHEICKALNRKKFKRAKNIVKGLAEEKVSLKGKYHTKTAKQLELLLKNLESNASVRNFEPDEMKLLISAHRGRTLFRARRKRSFGLRMKNCNVQAVLKKVK